MTKLLRIVKSEYSDQYEQKHKCWKVIEEVEVEFTGEYHEYQYYDTTIKNPIHRANDGRTWVQMVPTDFGGVSSFSLRENGIPVREEAGRWIKDYGLRTYGMWPVVRKEVTNDPTN
ncbi:MAG: hypothetical protein CMB99_00290 [Flavobacteriaceae bacterium]|nr:hypothetical protein [Flavobacteriaceae bacterium]|tara:strand:+ start:6295 stop:6642 length:348 start_codon:yes stop_codon:yes gene_type:complete